jgi:hypothetical protein
MILCMIRICYLLFSVFGRGGHIFTINRKPNRTVPNRTEISVFLVVRFGFGFCI